MPGRHPAPAALPRAGATSPSAPCAGRYTLAVTRRKEDEPTSTSIYNQNDPWTPTVAFADFVDNETITNEVSWGLLGGRELSTAGTALAPAPAGGFTHPTAKRAAWGLGRSRSAQRVLGSPRAGPGCLDLRGVPARPPR